MQDGMDRSDKQRWERIRPTIAPVRDRESLYDAVLAGRPSDEAIESLISIDPALASLLAQNTLTEAPSADLRAEILGQVARPLGRSVAVPLWVRWGSFSSLAASLVVSSAAGLYLGQSVKHAEKPIQTETGASLWIDDVEGLGLEGMVPSQWRNS